MGGAFYASSQVAEPQRSARFRVSPLLIYANPVLRRTTNFDVVARMGEGRGLWVSHSLHVAQCVARFVSDSSFLLL